MTPADLSPDPTLYLVLEREIAVPVSLVWRAWTEPEKDEAFLGKVMEMAKDRMVAALAIKGKHDRHDAIKAVKTPMKATATASSRKTPVITKVRSKISSDAVRSILLRRGEVVEEGEGRVG